MTSITTSYQQIISAGRSTRLQTLLSLYLYPQNIYQLEYRTTTSSIQLVTLTLHYRLVSDIYNLLCCIITKCLSGSSFHATLQDTTSLIRISKQILVHLYIGKWAKSLWENWDGILWIKGGVSFAVVFYYLFFLSYSFVVSLLSVFDVINHFTHYCLSISSIYN